MKVAKVDGTYCDEAEFACWTAAYGAAFAGEILALVRGGYGFEDALATGDGEAAVLIADAAVRAARDVARVR